MDTYLFFATFLTLFIALCSSEVDPRGYMVYCPCMGRFGNQAEHFLGSLAFAKEINRVLILPPWIQYDYRVPNSTQIPFDTFFKVEPIGIYHTVITMEKFMTDLAQKLWPPEERYAFCWSPRIGAKEQDCNAKDGNPFGPFWDHFKIDFIGSKFFGNVQTNDQWEKNFPPSDFPVLAFVGAPAAFPMREEHRELQRYLEWSAAIEDRAEAFIEKFLQREPFLGIHLRNDLDWNNVCKHVGQSSQLFSSAQCLGYRNEHGALNERICQPNKQLILDQVENLVKRLNVRSVFVAADRDHMINELNKRLKAHKIQAFKLSSNEPQIDLAILGKATYFIGNCVSSFSAFVKRFRDVKSLPSNFWGMAETPRRSGHEDL